MKLNITSLRKVRLTKDDVLIIQVPESQRRHFKEIDRQLQALPFPKGMIQLVMKDTFKVRVVSRPSK